MRFLLLLLLIFGTANAQTSGWPDETNTGVPAGTVLTTTSGNVTISVAGTIFENRNHTGCIVVTAPNVIIRRSKITGLNCGYSLIANQSTNLLIEDVELACQPIPGTNAATFGNYTIRRANVHSCENGLWANDNTIIEDSYVHDLIPYALWRAQDPHTDGIQTGAGSNNIIIRRNRIYGDYSLGDFGNAATTAGGGNISNYLLADNIVAGGGYTVRCEGTGNTNYRVINNRFSRIFVSTVGAFGPEGGCSANATQFTGNVYHETGLPLSGQSSTVTPNPPTGTTVQ